MRDSNNDKIDFKGIEVFYCYAHEDEALRKELEKHLKLLQRQGLIIGWHDRNISAGAEWKGEINTHLDKAQIILLLVSADFLASEFCYSVEMERALERHHTGEAHVIPVLLRPVDWEYAPFSQLLFLPTDAKPVESSKWHNRDEAFSDVAMGIRKVIMMLLAKRQEAKQRHSAKEADPPEMSSGYKENERAEQNPPAYSDNTDQSSHSQLDNYHLSKDDSGQKEFDTNTSHYLGKYNPKNEGPTQGQVIGEHISVTMNIGGNQAEHKSSLHSPGHKSGHSQEEPRKDIISILRNVFSHTRQAQSSSPTKLPRTIRPCSVHTKGAVIVHTKDRDYAYTGTGAMDVYIDGVISIETGNNFSSWYYIKDRKKHREPDNYDMHIHVCNNQNVAYSSPILLARLFITPVSTETRCVNKDSIE